jgi:SWI/SNF-related matrix-associated actin-dependent regulator 1 of chromatin subfamily A
MTGTPIYNRPLDLWPILYMLNPNRWGSYHDYGRKYCDGKYYGDDWDFRGASNLDLLKQEIEPYVIRRRKKDILPELPRKVRTIHRVELNASESCRGLDAWRDLSDSQFMGKLEGMTGGGAYGVSSLEDIARVRRQTALLKIPAAIELINNILDGGEKVVVFAWHLDILNALYDEYREVCVALSGATPVERRQDAVNAFQKDPSTRVFLGQIKAAGVGLTLTAASQVVFIELPWTPGEVTQAEDRCHRLGQTDCVVVHHIVGVGTFDYRMARGIVKKQNVIDGVFD